MSIFGGMERDWYYVFSESLRSTLCLQNLSSRIARDQWCCTRLASCGCVVRPATLRDVDKLQVLTVVRSKRSIQYFSGTNFLPLSEAWSSYAAFIERSGSFTFSRGTFL